MSGAPVTVAVAYVVPVALVVVGLLETADLLLAFAVEAGVLSAFAGLHAAFGTTLPDVPDSEARVGGLLARLLFVATAVCFGAGVLAATQVRWDWSSGFGVALVLVSSFAGLWRSSWQTGSLFPRGFGPVAWRLVVVLVGFGMCLPIAASLPDLRAAGWTPELMGGASGVPAPRWLVTGLLASGLPIAAWPAALLLLFRAGNEIAWSSRPHG